MTHIMFLLRVLVLALIPVNAFAETGNPEAIVLLEVELSNADGQDNTTVRYTMDDPVSYTHLTLPTIYSV